MLRGGEGLRWLTGGLRHHRGASARAHGGGRFLVEVRIAPVSTSSRRAAPGQLAASRDVLYLNIDVLAQHLHLELDVELQVLDLVQLAHDAQDGEQPGVGGAEHLRVLRALHNLGHEGAHGDQATCLEAPEEQLLEVDAALQQGAIARQSHLPQPHAQVAQQRALRAGGGDVGGLQQLGHVVVGAVQHQLQEGAEAQGVEYAEVEGVQVGLRGDALDHQVVGEPVVVVGLQDGLDLARLGFEVTLGDVVDDEVDLVPHLLGRHGGVQDVPVHQSHALDLAHAAVLLLRVLIGRQGRGNRDHGGRQWRDHGRGRALGEGHGERGGVVGHRAVAHQRPAHAHTRQLLRERAHTRFDRAHQRAASDQGAPIRAQAELLVGHVQTHHRGPPHGRGLRVGQSPLGLLVEVWVVASQVGYLHQMRAVLRPLAQAGANLVQGCAAEAEHLIVHLALVWVLPQRLKHVAQSNAKGDRGHQLVVDDCPEQAARDEQLLLWVLVVEAVLVEEVVHHAAEHLLVPLLRRALELLQQGDHLQYVLVGGVDLFEVLVRDALDLSSLRPRRQAHQLDCLGGEVRSTWRRVLLLRILRVRLLQLHRHYMLLLLLLECLLLLRVQRS
mmetsp:Transcript_13579/g.30420  ORF Transcript_13579/g.30420 Transcript_13579/m.30420 type:complete len:611 (-) Transcript_13579:1933-3765(-)